MNSLRCTRFLFRNALKPLAFPPQNRFKHKFQYYNSSKPLTAIEKGHQTVEKLADHLRQKVPGLPLLNVEILGEGTLADIAVKLDTAVLWNGVQVKSAHKPCRINSEGQGCAWQFCVDNDYSGFLMFLAGTSCTGNVPAELCWLFGGEEFCSLTCEGMTLTRRGVWDAPPARHCDWEENDTLLKAVVAALQQQSIPHRTVLVESKRKLIESTSIDINRRFELKLMTLSELNTPQSKSQIIGVQNIEFAEEFLNYCGFVVTMAKTPQTPTDTTWEHPLINPLAAQHKSVRWKNTNAIGRGVGVGDMKRGGYHSVNMPFEQFMFDVLCSTPPPCDNARVKNKLFITTMDTLIEKKMVKTELNPGRTDVSVFYEPSTRKCLNSWTHDCIFDIKNNKREAREKLLDRLFEYSLWKEKLTKHNQ
eukprot:GDKI01000874.1.p1 GENE.GDKI01000874.1~~GDKI01000874.1.p1  ORF type:complete len:419 (-),score=4.89 GDKI01000874.1:188-1444(-)